MNDELPKVVQAKPLSGFVGCLGNTEPSLQPCADFRPYIPKVLRTREFFSDIYVKPSSRYSQDSRFRWMDGWMDGRMDGWVDR